MELNFYATPKDIRVVLRYVFANTDFRVYESQSQTGESLRELQGARDLRFVYTDSRERYEQLRFYSPSVSDGLRVKKYELAEKVGGGFRYSVNGFACVSLVHGGMREFYFDSGAKLLLQASGWGNYSERGARDIFGDDAIDQVDYKRLESLSRRVQRHIRVKLAAATYRRWPILPDAFDAMQSGLQLFGEPGIVDLESEFLEVRSDKGLPLPGN